MTVGLARRLFDEMTARNVVSWTTIISVYHHAGFPHDALDLYRSMLLDGGVRPNVFTFTIALNCCASVEDLDLGVRIHEDIVKDGCDGDEFIIVALIDVFAKCGRLSDAREVFDNTSSSSLGINLNPTADLYERSDRMIAAKHVLDCLVVKDLDLWARMVSGFTKNEQCVNALKLYVEMAAQDARLNPQIMSLAIKACIGTSGLEEGKQMHGILIKLSHLLDDSVISSLAELYRSCGEYETAQKLLKNN